MSTTFKLFFSCLFCLPLILLSGCGDNAGQKPVGGGTTEIQIGGRNTFQVSYPRADMTESFSMVIHVSVLKADSRKFERQYEAHKNKVIDRVTSVLRASTTEERMEVMHTTIKEKVKDAIDDALETPLVQEVFFSEITHSIE